METLENFKTAIRHEGKTLAWAAREMEVSYPHLHHVVTGRRNLSDLLKNKMDNLLNKLRLPKAV